jgi:hypothetical protein
MPSVRREHFGLHLRPISLRPRADSGRHYKADCYPAALEHRPPAFTHTLAILFCLLLAQGGSENIKQPHCRG